MKTALIVLLVLAVLVLVVPLLIPVRPLEGTVPPEDLADADSRFAQVSGLQIHYKLQGEGEPALILLHGFASSTVSWKAVMPTLSTLGTTVAFDRPGFGLTQRPMAGEWEGENPYGVEAQADQAVELMDRLGIRQAILVGHSAGGAVAILATLRHPERVECLVLVDAAVYAGGPPSWLGPVLRTPQMRRLGPLVARAFGKMGTRLLDSAWFDPAKVPAGLMEGYQVPLRAENWDRALWELTMASRPLHLERRLAEVKVPVLVITGEQDRIVPPEQSVRLADELPDAELVSIPQCGHVPQEECPEAFLEAVRAFLDRQSGITE